MKICSRPVNITAPDMKTRYIDDDCAIQIDQFDEVI